MSDPSDNQSRDNAVCPRCGATDYHESTTIDLAFGEEIPCKVCNNCAWTFAYGAEGERGS